MFWKKLIAVLPVSFGVGTILFFGYRYVIFDIAISDGRAFIAMVMTLISAIISGAIAIYFQIID